MTADEKIRSVQVKLREAVAQTVQLKFLHKFWLCEFHRRQPVDRSIPAYMTLGILLNPTGGSRWIVQSQPARPITESKGRD